MKNDYTKMFVMLRPVRAGMEGAAGFVRIEIRSGKGRMNASVQGIKREEGERLTVVLLGEGGKPVFACGDIVPGIKGQSTLALDFDPANVGGTSILNYHTAALISRKPSAVQAVIAGVFGKFGVKDWDEALAAFALSPTEVEKADASADGTARELPPVSGLEEDAQGEGASLGENEQDAPARLDNGAQEREETKEADAGEENGQEKSETNEEGKQEPDEEAEPQETFTEQGGMEMPRNGNTPVHLCVQDLVWQGYAFAMKNLFEKYPATEPFDDLEDMFFVRVDMPVRSAGADHYILGAHARDGEVDILCIGVPGLGGAIPPAGLEGTVWHDGKNGGYWLSWQDAYMGYPIRVENR